MKEKGSTGDGSRLCGLGGRGLKLELKSLSKSKVRKPGLSSQQIMKKLPLLQRLTLKLKNKKKGKKSMLSLILQEPSTQLNSRKELGFV